MLHFASGTKTESWTRSFTGSSRPSWRTAQMSASRSRRMAVCASEGKRATLKLVGRLTCRTFTLSSGGRNACGSGLQRHAVRVEAVPDRGIGVAIAQRRDVEAGDAREVRQRRHVHDRHARHARLGHRGQQLAHAGRAVLRLLHREAHEVVVARVHAGGTGGGQRARHRSRVELDQALAPLHGDAHANAFGIDEVGFRGQAHEVHLVPRGQQLDREQGAVRGAQKQNAIRRAHQDLLHADAASASCARRREAGCPGGSSSRGTDRIH